MGDSLCALWEEEQCYSVVALICCHVVQNESGSALRSGNRNGAIKYALLALKYNILNLKLYAILIIAILPIKLR